MTDTPATPRFSLPDPALLGDTNVTQIVLLTEGEKPTSIDIDLPATCHGTESVTLADVCREIKRRRLAGTMPQAQILMFYTKFADANDPAPSLLWVYDSHAMSNRSLVVAGTYSYAYTETWEIQPTGGLTDEPT